MSWAADGELDAIFAAEAEDRLASIDAGLLALEAGVSPDILVVVRRDVHSLKGSAKLLGFDAVAELGHAIEDVLVALADGHRPLTSEVGDVLADAMAVLARLVRTRARDADEAQREALRRLHGLWDAGVGAMQVSDAVVAVTMRSAHLLGDAGPPRAPVVPTAQTRQAPSPPGIGVSPEVALSADDESVVRLRAAKIYELVDAVGEAGIGARGAQEQARRLQALSRKVEQRCRRGAPHGGDLDAFVTEIREELTRLARDVADQVDATRQRLDDVQVQALRLAMFPAATALAPLPRLVRELCRSLGKDVALELDDGGCELDKQVVDALAAPLRALLLNAIDHGVEDPAERSRAGKPAQASVRVSVASDAGRVRFRVADDGRGIDAEAVRAKAVEAGVLAEDAVFTAADVPRILCLPGFSTAARVTDVSGRGVGLDVVAQEVARLGGTIDIESQPGAGATFVLDVPAHLALIEVVFARLGDTRVAIPVSAVQEVVAVSRDLIGEVGGRTMLRCAGADRAELWPLVSLESLLWPSGTGARAPSVAVIVRAAGRQVAFGIDELCGQTEIVVRSTGTFLPDLAIVTGATILGDGSVVLVLDPVALCEAVRTGAADRAVPQSPDVTPASRVLVVDDSHPIREMERSILEAAGYDVVTAADGSEAMQVLLAAPFDAVVTDVEMPEMGGLELCARIRSTFGPLPVVMVTSRASDDDRRRGLEVGANAYLSKGSFDQAILVDTLAALVG